MVTLNSKMRVQIGFYFFQILSFYLLNVVHSMNVDLYLNKDKFGEYFKLEISEKGCTNVPLNWENQASSLDTHGSCIKFYDLPYCRGKFVALQPYHGTFQDNLNTLGFDKLISSASPCGPKVPAGRYYIQNGADGSVLTIDTKNGTAVARTKAFRPYIAKGQQFQVEKVALADYELIPRVHEKMNPLTFDMSVSTGQHPVRRTWKIESVYRGKYIIKNEWNNRCLYKSENGKVEEHECVIWSPNQEWMFRSIKVKPFFPSKEELKKKPIRPYDDFPFDPPHTDFQQVAQQFPIGVPGLKNRFRPKHPAIALGYNPKETFPPVLPHPILPGPVLINKNKRKPTAPVPQIRHPGLLPFPAEPLVTLPRQPVYGNPKPNSKVAKKKKNKDEDENEEEEEKKSEEEQDDLKSDEKDADKKSEENEDTKSEEKKSEEVEDKKSEEEKDSEEKQSKESVEKELEEPEDEEDDRKHGRGRKEKVKKQQPVAEEEETDKPKYSDFRLYF